MRSFKGIILFLLFTSYAFVQAQTYGNEWIGDYNKPYYKIKVVKNGLYRIPYTTLDSQISATQLSTINGTEFRLYNKGQLVPIHVSTTGHFSSSDFIEFYGEKNDGGFDTNLYNDPNHQPHTYYSLFNDTAVYFLTWNTGAGLGITNLSYSQTMTPPLPAKDPYLICTVRNVYTNTYTPGKPTYGNDGRPVYRSIFDEGEGYTHNLPLPQDYYISTPHPYNSSITASLKTVLVGTTTGGHHVVINFNGVQVKNETFTDFMLKKYDITLPSSSLQAFNTISFAAPSTGSNNSNYAYLNELIYPSQFNFDNNSAFLFTLPDKLGDRYMEIDNFNDKNTTPILYDLTNRLRIEGIPVSVPHKFKLPFASGERKLFLTNKADIVTVTTQNFAMVSFINYGNPDNQGDYIIITHPSLQSDGSGNNPVGRYSKYRSSVEGGGFKVQTILIDELYDQFAYGIVKHPLAIRNFISFATGGSWLSPPDYIFIIGKALEYYEIRDKITEYNFCTVPTFGQPGSDILLSASLSSITPRVAIGRLSVYSGDEINTYYDKVVDFEANQVEVDPIDQTIANKLWMKQIIHLGGGSGAGQQSLFKFYLEGYESTIEDTLYGGNVTSFFKTTSAPIEQAKSELLSYLIDNGVSLITFFGHSGGNNYDLEIDKPENFNNYQKYPVILSNGCFSGNIFDFYPGKSEEYVLIPDKGAIAYVSTIGLSDSRGLHEFSKNFYQHLGKKYYGAGLGTLMQKSIESVESVWNSNSNTSRIIMAVAEEMTLNGDPALKINTHLKPDYAIEPQMVAFDPAVVSVESETFNIKLIVSNLGYATADSINIIINREMPNGTGISYAKRIRGTYYSDTLLIPIETGSSSVFGLNKFCVKIDPVDNIACTEMVESEVGEIDELSESNNEISDIFLNILAEDVFPIYPYEFAIVPNPDTLYASTADVFAGEKGYIMQIDTTELFNSPLKLSTSIVQNGGVLKWKPSMNYQDSTVYYWRVGVDTSIYGGSFPWHYSSFIYIDGSYPGWNQSHYYQYLKDNYTNMYLDTDREFKYVGSVQDISVTTGAGVALEQIAYYLNTVQQHYYNCGGTGGFGGGLCLAVFDSITCSPWVSKYPDDVIYDPVSGLAFNKNYGSIHCKPRDFYGFDFYVGDASAEQNIIQFINSVPTGNYILVYSVRGAIYNSWSQNFISFFNNIGSTLVDSLVTLGNINPSNYNATPWAFFVKKGYPSTAKEQMGSSNSSLLNFTATFNCEWYDGKIKTPLIGPAFSWGSEHWKHHPSENPTDDNSSVDIIGVNYSGTETILMPGVTDLDNFLNTIDANVYPFLKLKLNTRDDDTRTPTQLDYWRVIYERVPEAALNPSFYLEFFDDTLSLGEDLKLSVAVQNVTDINMDSLLVKYTIVTASNQPIDSFLRYDSLKANQTMILNYTFNTNCTNCLGDLNYLTVEVNPDNDQPEQFHFNNIGTLSFSLNPDKINPLLDVTFDGVHIMDGDIVSAEPGIAITLKDENKYLRLDDSSLINVYIQYPAPDARLEQLRYDGVNMIFYPAELSGKNKARVELYKKFDVNGIYRLLVQAEDKSRNASGYYDYKVSFEIVKEATITNVLNYPNPFTTATHFVFTLTGSQVPTYFKIQIFTISGKVVREIALDELGPIHVGKNITEFAWNGTDEFGDPLGNGLYLYRVVASIDGKPIERMEKSIDKYFKSGFGKMYMAR